MLKPAKIKYVDFVFCIESEAADTADKYPKFRVEIKEHQQEYVREILDLLLKEEYKWKRKTSRPNLGRETKS